MYKGTNLLPMPVSPTQRILKQNPAPVALLTTWSGRESKPTWPLGVASLSGPWYRSTSISVMPAFFCAIWKISLLAQLYFNRRCSLVKSRRLKIVFPSSQNIKKLLKKKTLSDSRRGRLIIESFITFMNYDAQSWRETISANSPFDSVFHFYIF